MSTRELKRAGVLARVLALVREKYSGPVEERVGRPLENDRTVFHNLLQASSTFVEGDISDEPRTGTLSNES